MRKIGVLAVALLCCLGPMAACMAADPPKTGEKRDTMIYVRSDPPGAKIFVDGKELGKTNGLFRVEAGVATVILELEGHGQVKKEHVTIRADGITRLEIELKPQGSTAETKAAASSQPPQMRDRHFVRIVAGKDGLTFEGTETTWEELPTLLEKVRNRKQTVLEVAIASNDISVKIRDDAVGNALRVARRLGFEYVSDIGVHPLGSKGSPSLKVAPLPENPLSNTGAEAADAAVQSAKRVHLPDADEANRGREVILDLATGQMLKVPQDVNGRLKMPLVFTEFGKGDVFFDRTFGCLRGGSAKKWDGLQFVDFPPKRKGRDAIAYELPSLPCRLLITTAEKKQFDVTILSAANNIGVDLEYREYRPATGPMASLNHAQEAPLRELVAKFVAAATKGEEFPLKHMGPQLHVQNDAREMRKAIAAGANVSDVRFVRIKGDRALVVMKSADITDRKYVSGNPWSVIFAFVKQGNDWALNDIDLRDEKGLAEGLKRFDTGTIVLLAVTAISHCAEGDPRVEQALKSLRPLDQSDVVKAVIPYLGSSSDTIRRSAIYILWRGKLTDIKPAVPALEKLLGHEEVFTRGMAALALGQNKVSSSYDALVKMTASDSSGYARRCAAIALGWLGDPRAKPTLEAALKDSDPLVATNAEAALEMLKRDRKPADKSPEK